eukprot:TRINITY_DN2062_c0_g1_i2.p1 TRINITY_DN2062_c0_g1~~TRINITY_DN2062_c0_g1_i2.p1  ORF type:complete len:434 (-),score=60.94 TRINITY_DN2062_c0_g1_i2:31-1332(-)
MMWRPAHNESLSLWNHSPRPLSLHHEHTRHGVSLSFPWQLPQIKVERPGSGDPSRNFGPPFVSAPEGSGVAKQSTYFMSANRNKRSVALDFSKEEGQKVIRQIAAKSDVLVENYRVGALARYNLSYEDLKAVNPRLVYCSITGFGQSGPRSSEAGYDFAMQAMGGLMSVTGEPDGAPMRVGVAIVDLMTGMYATVGILAALRQRDMTGEGQHIDTSLFDVQASMLAYQATTYLATGETPKRVGNAHPSIVPYASVRASDSWFVLAVGADRQFELFCRLANICDEVGLTDKTERWKRFETNENRVKNREELMEEIIRPAICKHPVAWWQCELAKAGVPCGPINTIDEMFADKQAKARHCSRVVNHPSLGEIKLGNHPFHMSGLVTAEGEDADAPQGPFRAPPTLGQHTEEVLTDPDVCGMTQEELRVLVEKGIV